MNLIRHIFDIEAPPETVFTSITTADGLSSRWTTKVEADTAERGSLFSFTFRGPFNPQLRITEIELPSLVAWEGVRGHDAWGSTTIRFRLDPVESGRWFTSGTRWDWICPTMLSRQPTSPGGTTSTACAFSAKRVTAGRIRLALQTQELVPRNSNGSCWRSSTSSPPPFQDAQPPGNPWQLVKT